MHTVCQALGNKVYSEVLRTYSPFPGRQYTMRDLARHLSVSTATWAINLIARSKVRVLWMTVCRTGLKS